MFSLKSTVKGGFLGFVDKVLALFLSFEIIIEYVHKIKIEYFSLQPNSGCAYNYLWVAVQSIQNKNH